MPKHIQEGNNVISVDSTAAVEVSNNANNAVVFDIDTTNKMVGIGTGIPGSVLDVRGNFALTSLASLQSLNVANGLSGSILALSSLASIGSLNIGNDAYARYVFASGASVNWFTGSLGIGTTSPSASFSVAEKLLVTSGGVISKYNNVNTVGWGVQAIYGYTRPAQQVNSLVTLAAYTVGAADGSFMVSANINVTVATASLIGVTCTYTDESNASRVLVLNFSNIAGVFAITTTLNTAGAFEGVPLHIRAKAGTSITLATTGTVTTATYTAEGIITQIS